MNLNATLERLKFVTADLAILHVRPDGPPPAFKAGQYAVLGLPVEGKLVRRAYSIASAPNEGRSLEFYIKKVPNGRLTPRLFELSAGDRLWLGPKVAGRFTLDRVEPGRSLIMIATGTGLAPYISMIRSAHVCGEGPQFTVVHGVRDCRDLGYREELARLDASCPNFRYVPTLSRPELCPGWQGHVGRVNTVFETGRVVAQPEKDDVFLCGSPEMIRDMQAYFERRGYTLDRVRDPGNLHVERYW